jgi:hypothetical protein
MVSLGVELSTAEIERRTAELLVIDQQQNINKETRRI